MNKSRFLAVVAIFMAFFISACEQSVHTNAKKFSFKSLSDENMEITTQSDAAALQLSFSKSIFLQSQKRPVLLYFVSKNCADCLDLLPHIVDIQNRHRDDIYIIGIAGANEREFLASLVAKSGVDFPLFTAFDSKNLAEFWGISPTESNILFFNKNGEKIFHYQGRVLEEMILFDIKTELENMAK